MKRLANVQAVANNLEVRLPTTWVRDDEKLATAALAALTWRFDIPADKIKLVADHGWIRLEGAVDWEYERKAAEKAVRNLIGVRGVTNLITLKPHVASRDVREHIEAALKRDATLEAARIDVLVDGTTVTLRGSVHTWPERSRAEDAAWAAKGVTTVKNNLTVEPYVFA